MMTHMPIAQKLTVLYTIIVGVSVILAAFTLYQANRLSAGIDRELESRSALKAVKSYQRSLFDAQETMLRLLNSSDIQDRETLEAELADLGPVRAALNKALSGDREAMSVLARIDRQVTTWRNDVVAAQLKDMRDPRTVDVARVREATVENRERWATIEALFTDLEGIGFANSDAAAADMSGQLASMRIGAIGSAVILFGMCVVMALAARRSVAEPLGRLAALTERLKDRDWTVAVSETDRGDEIGRMARALEVFRDNGRRQETLEERQREDAESRVAAAEEVRQAVALFRDSAERLLGDLGGAGSRLDQAAGSLNSVVGTSQTYTRTVSEAAEATGESVQNVAAAIEEMSLSIRDVSSQLQSMSGLAQRSAEASAQAGEKVSGLKERSAKIHSVVDLINGIAGQINLLALNATIESARAGEAGKGFAVVAQQVKQLADETGRATEDITRVIAEVQADVTAVVSAIGTIDSAIAEVNTSSSTVAAAVEQQSTALDEISRNVANVSSQTSQVVGNVKGVETKVRETCEVADNVHQLSDNLRTSSTTLETTIEDFIGKVANDSGSAGSTRRSS